MHIEIYDIDSGDLNVQVGDEQLVVEQVTRTRQGNYITVTIELLDETDTEEEMDETDDLYLIGYDDGYEDGLNEGRQHGTDREAPFYSLASDPPYRAGGPVGEPGFSGAYGSLFNR